MQTKANAKINLGLNVLKRRKDGFHEIESVFLPIDLYDELEIKPSEKEGFSTTGIKIPESKSGNLCMKAVALLKKDHAFPALHIHLHKRIPIGAGLGGGSSDATFVLKAIKQQFDLNIGVGELEDYAAQLGSDCVFFVRNKAALVSGRGEQIITNEKYNVLKGYQLLLIKPKVFVSTKEAYENIKPQLTARDLEEIIQQPIGKWKSVLKNDFEASAFMHHPELKELRKQLYEVGALYAAMSGSGSCLYGVFEKRTVDTSVFDSYWWKWAKTI